MDKETIEDFAKYRLEKAKELIKLVEEYLKNNINE